jgi:hypothetical protein
MSFGNDIATGEESTLDTSASSHATIPSADVSYTTVSGLHQSWSQKLPFGESFPWSSTAIRGKATSEDFPDVSVGPSPIGTLQRSTIGGSALNVLKRLVVDKVEKPLQRQDTGSSLWSWWSFGTSSAGDPEEDVGNAMEEKEHKLLETALTVIER